MFREKSNNEKQKNNVVDTLSKPTKILLQILGMTIYVQEYQTGKVVSKFKFLGFLGFTLWNIAYCFATYKAFPGVQSIVRAFYDTKLRYYGDAYEKITGCVFSLFVYWKIVLHINRDPVCFQAIVDIDNVFQKIGVEVQRQSDFVLYLTIAEGLAVGLRIGTTCGTLLQIGETNIPYYRIFQLAITDGIALYVCSNFCTHLILYKIRFKQINQILTEIKDSHVPTFAFQDRSHSFHSSSKLIEIRNKQYCDKIRECAKIYSMLYETSLNCNSRFGTVIVLTLMFPLSYIICNAFYFMEATASGVFHDVTRYMNLLLYLSWGILYNVLVIFSYVHFSESTMAETKATSVVLHRIMCADIDESVTEEAHRFSLQLLHQGPVFTAGQLINLDYPLLMEGGRFLITFMGLLLQFATTSQSSS